MGKFTDYILGQRIDESVEGSLQTVVDALIQAGNVAQVAHWNLRSGAFVAIHPWFGETYDKLFDMADDVAEQIKIADIDLMVHVSRGDTTVATDEEELFLMVQESLRDVRDALDAAGNDETLKRSLQNLIDGWVSDIDKMIWFIEASVRD